MTPHDVRIIRRWWSGEYVIKCKTCKKKRVLASGLWNEARITSVYHSTTGRW